MTRRDSFRGEYGDDEPVTEWSEAEKHPGRAISVVVVLAMATPPGIDAEQAEGEAVLDGALAGIKARAESEGAPLSQSAQAAAVREKLGLDK